MLQYENSKSLNTILDGFRDILGSFINPDKFYNEYFNLQTAIGEGLDNWGRILGISRTVQIEDYGNIFGFDVNPGNNTDYAQNFGDDSIPVHGGSFYDENASTGAFVSLPDYAYRNVLKLKYYRSISNGSLSTINSVMRNYFEGRGYPTITESLMQVTYDFTNISEIQPYEVSLFNNDKINILPTPSGMVQILIFP